jgi:hypothetical protein
MDPSEDIQQPENVSKALYKPVNVLDSRLNVNDSVVFAVEKGAMNNTLYKIPATSMSTSQVNFETKISSLSTIISRKAYVQATMTFAINAPAGLPADAPTGFRPFELGRQATLNAFPFQNGVVRNSSLTLNNQNFTLVNEETVDILLRSINPEKLKKASDTCPVHLNNYNSLNDAFEYQETYNGVLIGGRPLHDSVFYNNSCYDVSYADGGIPTAIGAAPQALPNDPVTAGKVGSGAYATTLIVVKVTEPVLMSPFILDDTEEESGVYGVDTLSLSFLLNSSADKTKAILTTLKGTTLPVTYSLQSISDCNLYLNFLTPHASLSLPSRNIVPYLQTDFKKYPCGTVSANAKGDVSSNSFTLNSTPDAVFISVRMKTGSANSGKSVSYLPINNINVNYGNRSGMFSNEPPENLYERSKANGLYMDFNSWKGTKNVMRYTTSTTVPAIAGTAAGAAFPGVAQQTIVNGVVPSVANVKTVGSIVLLNLARDGWCQQDSEAPGSISGNSVQISVNFTNNTGAQINAGDYELHCMFVYSGLIVNSLGSTNLYVGVLSKKEILEVSQMKSINKAVISRQYGGSLWSSLKSYGKKAYKMYKRTKPTIKQINNVMKEVAPDNKVSRGLSAVGYGYSGAGYSGAGKLKSRIY